MKHIYLNLKRFDIAPAHGGVNRLSPMADWARTILGSTEPALRQMPGAEYVFFLPELHLLPAMAARASDSPVLLGCQGVYRADTACGGNFGAFTTQRTAYAMQEAGCTHVLVGHCEERQDKLGILREAGITGKAAETAVNRLLNQEVCCAQQAGLNVLYCIGETAEQQKEWDMVLSRQLETGLQGADREKTVIAYEPVWSIGPGRTPADRPYIEKVARLVKACTDGLDVVYGGGLKQDNAAMLASIPEIDGGLIALTRFRGEIGFYPEEYLEIIRTYLGHCTV